MATGIDEARLNASVPNAASDHCGKLPSPGMGKPRAPSTLRSRDRRMPNLTTASQPLAPGLGIPVLMQTFDNKVAHGTIDVRMIGPGLRLLRALRALGWCWLFAAAALLIPVLHWVLVPSLTLLGPILALRAFGFDRQVSGGGGPCPVCQHAVVFPRSPHPESFTAVCRACRSSIDVQPEAASG
jgi:hypothetical protein